MDDRSRLVTPNESSSRTAVKSEETITKHEEQIIKIQITKYQEADMWNRKDYSVPRTKYDSMIHINDEPVVRQSIIEDSLKHIR